MLGRCGTPRQLHAEVPRCTTRPGRFPGAPRPPSPPLQSLAKSRPLVRRTTQNCCRCSGRGRAAQLGSSRAPALPCRRQPEQPPHAALRCLPTPVCYTFGGQIAVAEQQRLEQCCWGVSLAMGRAQPGVGVWEARCGENGKQKRFACCSRRAAHGRCVYISFGSVRSASIEGRCWYIGKAAWYVMRLEGGAAGQRAR